MSTIAIFSTYSPSESFGGPARVFHMRRVLEGAGHRVAHVVVQSRADRGKVRSGDLVEFVERPHGAPLDHIYEDSDLGRRAAEDPRVIRSVTEHLQRSQVELVVMEQPYLTDLVAKVSQALGIPVIYSCANIEYRLKRDLERFQPNWKRPRSRNGELRAMEQQAVDIARLVTAICPTDQEALKLEFGCDSTLVPNGTTIAELDTTVGADARSVPGPVDFVIAGSAYWPNIEGLAKIATPSLAFLPPTSRIHVCGSMSSQVLSEPTIADHYSVNSARLALRGFLKMDDLVATMLAARAVLVPIFTGEGSNLKSADALASGRPVIMTRRATRGYEDVIEADPEGLVIVDEATEFRAAMSDLIGAERSDSAVGRTRARLLSWPQRLEPLIDVVARALGSGATPGGSP